MCEIPFTQQKNILHKYVAAAATHWLVSEWAVYGAHDCPWEGLKSTIGMHVVTHVYCIFMMHKLKFRWICLYTHWWGLSLSMQNKWKWCLNDREWAVQRLELAPVVWHVHSPAGVPGGGVTGERRVIWSGKGCMKHALIATNDTGHGSAGMTGCSIWVFDWKQKVFLAAKGGPVNTFNTETCL